MKRTIIALLLLASTSASASTYVCQSSVLNGSKPRDQISSIYIEKTGVRIQTRGEIKEITGQYYSLEQAGDRFILKKVNRNMLRDGAVSWTQVLGDCRII